MLSSQLDTYLRLLPNAVARTRYYWGHGGASFTEQLENFGLPNPAEYGKHKEGDDLGVEKNKWLEYEWDTALEFCQMYKQILPWYPDSTLDKYQELVDSASTTPTSSSIPALAARLIRWLATLPAPLPPCKP